MLCTYVTVDRKGRSLTPKRSLDEINKINLVKLVSQTEELGTNRTGLVKTIN